MGYELSFKVELTGCAGTYLEGMICEVEVEEMCDDQGDPDSTDVNMTKLLDTSQGAVAKEVLGCSDGLDKFLSAIHKALKEYPYKQ